jgi:hypothetical protein
VHCIDLHAGAAGGGAAALAAVGAAEPALRLLDLRSSGFAQSLPGHAAARQHALVEAAAQVGERKQRGAVVPPNNVVVAERHQEPLRAQRGQIRPRDSLFEEAGVAAARPIFWVVHSVAHVQQRGKLCLTLRVGIRGKRVHLRCNCELSGIAKTGVAENQHAHAWRSGGGAWWRSSGAAEEGGHIVQEGNGRPCHHQHCQRCNGDLFPGEGEAPACHLRRAAAGCASEALTQI